MYESVHECTSCVETYDYEQSLFSSLVRRASEKKKKIGDSVRAAPIYFSHRFIFRSRNEPIWKRRTARSLLETGFPKDQVITCWVDSQLITCKTGFYTTPGVQPNRIACIKRT